MWYTNKLNFIFAQAAAWANLWYFWFLVYLLSLLQSIRPLGYCATKINWCHPFKSERWNLMLRGWDKILCLVGDVSVSVDHFCVSLCRQKAAFLTRPLFFWGPLKAARRWKYGKVWVSWVVWDPVDDFQITLCNLRQRPFQIYRHVKFENMRPKAVLVRWSRRQRRPSAASTRCIRVKNLGPMNPLRPSSQLPRCILTIK